MFELFGKKTPEQNGKTPDTVKIIDAMTSSLERLHAVGGLGYALVGISIVVGAIAVIIGKVVPHLFDLLIFVAVSGVVVAAIERYVTVKLATEKLKLISALTQEMVRASIPKTDKMDTSQIRIIMQEVFKEIWHLDIDKKIKQTD